MDAGLGPTVVPRANGVELTSFDIMLLTLIGEHFALSLRDLCRAVLVFGGRAVSERAIRARVDRWLRSQVVARVRRQGKYFVTLTTAGYRRVGLEYSVWSVPDARVAHISAVTHMRLWYESNPERVADGGAWVSERRLYRERGTQSWHLHDAELVRPGRDKRIGIEVELTRKTPATQRYGEILSSVGDHVGGVMYVCAPEIVDFVRRVTMRCAPVGLPVWVRALPAEDQS